MKTRTIRINHFAVGWFDRLRVAVFSLHPGG